MDQLTFLLEDLPAKASVLPDCEKACPTNAETSCWNILNWLRGLAPNGLCGKMSPAFCQAGADGILAPSSGRWASSGTGMHTGCWTLNTSEWPSGDAVCSLSEILETGDLPQRYFLTEKACQGILRRAEKLEKMLPNMLKEALKQAIGTIP